MIVSVLSLPYVVIFATIFAYKLPEQMLSNDFLFLLSFPFLLNCLFCSPKERKGKKGCLMSVQYRISLSQENFHWNTHIFSTFFSCFLVLDAFHFFQTQCCRFLLSLLLWLLLLFPQRNSCCFQVVWRHLVYSALQSDVACGGVGTASKKPLTKKKLFFLFHFFVSCFEKVFRFAKMLIIQLKFFQFSNLTFVTCAHTKQFKFFFFSFSIKKNFWPKKLILMCLRVQILCCRGNRANNTESKFSYIHSICIEHNSEVRGWGLSGVMRMPVNWNTQWKWNKNIAVPP